MSGRPINLGGVLLALAVCLLCLGPASASAKRVYDSSIRYTTEEGKGRNGFSGTTSVGFDAAGDAWITDSGDTENYPSEDGLFKYDPYPSQTLLALPNTEQAWGGSLANQLAVDQATGEVFVATSNPRKVGIFDENGIFTHDWTGINGLTGCLTFDCVPYIHIAIDNTDMYSKGRIYLSLTGPEDDIEVLDNGRRPVDFPATASYISGNKLTGTPSGPFSSVSQVAVDSEGNLYVSDTGEEVIDEFDWTGTFLRRFPGVGGGGYLTPGIAVDPINGNVVLGTGAEYDGSGNFLGSIEPSGASTSPTGTPAINSDGYLYMPGRFFFGNREDTVDIYRPDTAVPKVEYQTVGNQTATSGTLRAKVDPNGGGSVIACRFEYGTDSSYGGGTLPCAPDPESSPPSSYFSTTTEVSADLSALIAETTYHYRVVVESAIQKKYGPDQTFTPHGVLGLTTEPASNVTESSATLNGSLLGSGSPTHYLFEWGPTAAYGSSSAVAPGTSAGSPNGPSRTELSFTATGLAPFSTYHYRIVATDASGTSYGEDRMLTTPPGAPTVAGVSVTSVHSDRALMHAQINANGGVTEYSFEYVDDAGYQANGWTGATTVNPSEPAVGSGKHLREASTLAPGLKAGTKYRYRAVATNAAGTGTAEGTFQTFPFIAVNDPCPNSHVRQQTGAAQLLDCRAYELASAADTGGYDVESDLEGGTPFGGYPRAEGPSQLLYGVDSGAIAGTGSPTNHGLDPYVATRNADGWVTKYVGIPADGTPSDEAFGSSLLEADAGLDTLAFGGEICAPCFSDGSTGIPVHTPQGSLVQGMAGSIAQPSATPAGYIGRSLSADGSHLVFGSTSKFESDGNSNGDISIYDRNLVTSTTHVVSKTPGGATMTGPGIGELDISSDGSRIVIGQLVSTDSQGNRYWHLYMNVGDSSHAIDLTPGTTGGALYDGMTGDGSRVFFTTSDQLSGDDTDASADIYEMDLANPAAPVLTRISTGSGGAGNSDACDPAANSRHEHWNSVEGSNCDAVAIGGGGGVASASGAFYFLSPELLDGPSNGVADAPNLYLVAPGPEAPRFVATLESSANAPLPSPVHRFQRYIGNFEKPGGVAIDPVDGSIYVLDVTGATGGSLSKFESNGHADTSFGDHGKLDGSNTPSGGFFEEGLLGLPAQIAVDTDPSSPSYRDVYVPDWDSGVVDKFGPSGNYLSQLESGGFSAAAVDPSNGKVYVTRNLESTVTVYSATGVELEEFEVIFRPTGIAIDPSSGHIYVVNGAGPQQGIGKTEVYDLSGNPIKLFTGHPSQAVSVDPTSGHVFIDEGSQVTEFDSSGSQIGNPFGAGVFSQSFSMSAQAGRVVVANPHEADVAAFAPPILPDNNATDNPAVVDSVSSAATRKTGDFQVTPSGSFAAFPSAMPLTGYDNAEHREVFRYGATTGTMVCASCNSTDEQATGEAGLAPNGLSLTDDGRLFFNAQEGLVDRDLNEKKDAYEWEEVKGKEQGVQQLVSSGTGNFDASLLGASADGVDAYFFTHATLAAGDLNGGRVKIYDARENGGFPFVPPPVPCQASDECHGAGSPVPPPPTIPSTSGTPAPSSAGTHGKSKHRRHHRHKHRKHKRHGGGRHG